MRVLLTGGAGFIGSHLAEAFVARGDDVLAQYFEEREKQLTSGFISGSAEVLA